MEEIWRDVKGYDGVYQVSNFGRIRSFYRSSGKIKKPDGQILLKKIHRGYELVGLWNNGTVKRAKVHRLVAEAFIPNPDKLPFVNHINEVKSDNVVTNLEWCTPKYNSNYGNAVDKRMNTLRRNNRPFICIETGKVYNLASDCAKELNCKPRGIRDTLQKRQESYKNYHFKYI